MRKRGALATFVAIAAVACGGDDAEIKTLDANVEPAREPVTAETDAANEPPVVDSVELTPDRPRPGEQLVAQASASDPDGDPVQLEYRWMVGGRRMDETGPFLHVQGAGRDTSIEVTVIASDGQAQSRPESASTRVGNLPPRVLQVVIEPLGEVAAGRDIVATPAGTDADGDPIEYRFNWSVNGDSVFDQTSTLSSENYKRGDEIVLEIVASDGLEDSEPLRSAPIKVVNAAPRITSTPGALSEDGTFSYQVTAEDPDGDSSFRYRLLKSPEGMTISFDDGKLFWSPGGDLAGNHPVEIEVADRFGGKSTQLFEIRLSYAAADAPAEQAPAEEE